MRNEKDGERERVKSRREKQCTTEGRHEHRYKSAAVGHDPSYAFVVPLRHFPTVKTSLKTDRKLRQYFREILTRL